MRIAVAAFTAAVALVGARLARVAAAAESGQEGYVTAPYAPSPSAAPFISLGYRELMADLMHMRLRVYWGGYYDTTADGVAALAEATVTLDPTLEQVYEYGANAMTIAEKGVDQKIYLRAIALLERGMARFPQNHTMPLLAGQMYIQDLKTDDPVQRRAWDERGVLHVESAIRKPGAPVESAGWAAHIRSKLGQHERASQGLREVLLLTNDTRARKRLIDRLAALEETDAGEIAAEVFAARRKFENAWRAERPGLKPSMYILLGPRPQPGFDLADLATGGRDLISLDGYERLEPVVDAEPDAPGVP